MTGNTLVSAITTATYCNMKCADNNNCGGAFGISIYPAVPSTPKDVNFQLSVVKKLIISSLFY
jgi:hypothetical protein